MDGQVGQLLEECLKAAAAVKKDGEEERRNYCACRDSLCAELECLLQEALEMKWPFVPEKWQYKQSVSAKDKTNLSDLISQNLHQLLIFLRSCILAEEVQTALAVAFLVDRFLYWADESSRLLRIVKLLHRRQRGASVAPQLVIRQARVYLNSGKLQKAEFILCHLISNNGATGCWVYHSESDRALVQSVCLQIRGVVLQKLGLWLEAAELIWASLIGYYSLPQPDKKGIGTSLGILANIMVSMNNQDFQAFKSIPDIDLSLLGDGGHRLLSAAEAAKLAVVYSQYTSLYVLTNVTSQGTCLLSYSFSLECTPEQRHSSLLQAREAFEIGLLTKSEGEVVSSVQELHTFIKAAYSLAVTHKWLGTATDAVEQAKEACQKALALFYDYCKAQAPDRDSFCIEIMRLVTQVKRLLQVKPFVNSDKGSFIPDFYRKIKDTSVSFTLQSFFKVMLRFKKYHASLCEARKTDCPGATDGTDGARSCITALGTTVSTLNTECTTEACKVSEELGDRCLSDDLVTSPGLSPQMSDQCGALRTTESLGSSWQNVSFNCSVSPQSSGSSGSLAFLRARNANRKQICPTTETEEEGSENHGNNAKDSKAAPGASSPTACAALSSGSGQNSGNVKVTQADIGTACTEEDGVTPELSVSLSELQMSSSLSWSFGSHSSWERISADMNSPTYRRIPHISKQAAFQRSKSSGSSGSFHLLETLESDTAPPNLTEARPQPHGVCNDDPVLNCEVTAPADYPDQPQLKEKVTNTFSTENSFEVLEESPSQAPAILNSPCYSCRNRSWGEFAPETQYFLTPQDYFHLLSGVCHECLMRRLHSDQTKFKLKTHGVTLNALHLKFSKASGLWMARETCVYIGQPMEKEGKQRRAIWVQFLHQEERLSSYVGKDYLNPKQLHFHLKDVERQMTAQFYITEFNKSLYDKDVMAQIFFIPSEALLLLRDNEIVGCLTVEPFMLGDFVKLTNNTVRKDTSFEATEYGLAFGHFTYLFSNHQEIVVDLQGWVTANGKGLTYLTDPQIHSTKTSKGPSNFADRGIRYFLEDQHGPQCTSICQLLQLPPVAEEPQILHYNS
ncbi:alpha-protein kinase 1 [Synchiropus splendidus]|uniref:alpha-protein kinase 1 n=1 Tax=Synchiropus splendidus TaxID=270530 RepID=UPI00237D7300|nr:alpha-protein kinase 1 [Synchiropus splendidus]XP_053715663.1 alpha-protein kinase 1 [Synchiropus splendidus]XP_053715664.1 alpha-protein kinase 1 [Synchiropus splendidus]